MALVNVSCESCELTGASCCHNCKRLHGNKCGIHDAKPEICALWPIVIIGHRVHIDLECPEGAEALGQLKNFDLSENPFPGRIIPIEDYLKKNKLKDWAK